MSPVFLLNARAWRYLFIYLCLTLLQLTPAQAGAKFRAWNAATETCYFPEQRNLRYFTSYMQDNCKRECSWNKYGIRNHLEGVTDSVFRTISACGCAPKSFHLDNVLDCGQEGLKCWGEEEHTVTEEEEAACNCKQVHRIRILHSSLLLVGMIVK